MKIYKLAFITILFLLAQPIFAAAPKSDPFAEGVRLFNEGQYDQATPQLADAVQSAPNDVVRRLTYGIALMTARQYDDAIAQFQEVSKALPQDPVPYFLLEAVYLAKGQSGDAQLAHASAKTKLAGTQSIGSSMLGSSTGNLEQRLAQYPDNAIAQNLLGDISQVHGRFVKAIAYYTRATQLAPNWSKAWFNLGIADLKVNAAQAVDAFNHAIAVDPKNLQAELWLGDAYAALNDLDHALQAYQAATKDASLEAAARSRIGNLYLKQNNPSGAEQEFRKAQAKAPQDATTAAGLGDALQQQQRLDESEKEYKKASDLTQLSPSMNSVVAPNLASVYMEKGEYKKAISELKRSLAINPDSWDTIRRLVEAYSKDGSLQKASQEYEGLLSSNKNNLMAMQFLVAAYGVSGNAEGRAEMARKLIKRLPDQSDVWNKELGCALVALKDNDGALTAWRSGLESNPLMDSAEILKEAQSAGLLGDLKSWYERESAARKQDSPALVLANIYEFENDFAQAAEVRQMLVEKYPDKQHFWVLLGDDLAASGKISDATDAYTHAVGMTDPSISAVAEQRIKDLKQ